MDISIALEVISYLNTEFDSHDFIRKLLEKHPEVYGRYLVWQLPTARFQNFSQTTLQNSVSPERVTLSQETYLVILLNVQLGVNRYQNEGNRRS